MAKRNPAKGIKNAAKLGAGGGATVGLGNVAAGAGYETFVPATVHGVDGQMVHTAVSHIVPAVYTPMEGLAHTAITTGAGALGAAALIGATHLGLKAYDSLKNRNLGRQFK